jgi:hypothetical protein
VIRRYKPLEAIVDANIPAQERHVNAKINQRGVEHLQFFLCDIAEHCATLLDQKNSNLM